MDDDTNKPDKPTDNQSVAANIIRGDIGRIFDSDNSPHAEAEQAITSQHNQSIAASSEEEPPKTIDHLSASEMSQEWKHYHTSWQSYYQQYYERYYLHHLRQSGGDAPASATEVIGSNPAAAPTQSDKTVNALREKLLSNIKGRADTLKKSRHFMPIITALVFALVFLFLQFNRFMFANVEAYVRPGSIDPQNIIVDPNASLKVGPEPKMVIPKINVEAPVVYGADSSQESAVQKKLRDGVVHYPIAGAASKPGQNGATVILGHSSNDVFDSGDYKFIFVQLSKLEKGDTFYINYKGARYTYSITKKEVIDPSEVGKVKGDPSKPTAILITCDPPGTVLKRLLVFAEQISPDPATSKKAPAKADSSTNNITGNSPTFLERVFGAR